MPPSTRACAAQPAARCSAREAATASAVALAATPRRCQNVSRLAPSGPCHSAKGRARQYVAQASARPCSSVRACRRASRRRRAARRHSQSASARPRRRHSTPALARETRTW
eukprot:1060599-Pleurochrysis_carterae.AAC.5